MTPTGRRRWPLAVGRDADEARARAKRVPTAELARARAHGFERTMASTQAQAQQEQQEQLPPGVQSLATVVCVSFSLMAAVGPALMAAGLALMFIPGPTGCASMSGLVWSSAGKYCYDPRTGTQYPGVQTGVLGPQAFEGVVLLVIGFIWTSVMACIMVPACVHARRGGPAIQNFRAYSKNGNNVYRFCLLYTSDAADD